MFRRTTLLIALFSTASAVAWGATKGPDGGGYRGTDDTVYSFVDVSGGSGGVRVLAGVDDGMAALTLPFAFRFYGQQYTVVCISSNGALYFVSAAGGCNGFTDFVNTDLSSTAVPNDLPALLPFWMDLTFDGPGGGAVFYSTLGAPGSRRFVVQWSNAYPQGSPNPVTFQAILAEGSNSVLFQYKTVGLGAANAATNGAQATVGIRNGGAPANQQQIAWSYNAPVIGEDSALLFSAVPTASCATNVNATVSIRRSGYIYNPGTRRFGQTVTVTNTSAAPLTGPLALALDNLTASVTLFNAAGATNCAAPAGRPFVINNAGTLAAGSSVSFTLQFVNPNKVPIGYSTRVLAGSETR